MQEVNIAGANKAAILAALYNASRQQGLGVLQRGPESMSIEQAQQVLDSNPRQYFDYLFGRVMKVDLATDTLRLHLFDRDNGEGAGYRAIQELIQSRVIVNNHLKPIEPLNIETIRSWEFVGNAWSDGPAFESIWKFAQDESQSYEHRAEAINLMGVNGMGLDPETWESAEEYVNAYLAEIGKLHTGD